MFIIQLLWRFEAKAELMHSPLSVVIVSAALSVTAQSLNKVDLQKQVSCMFPSYDLRLWSKIGGNAWVGSSRGWNQATSHSETSPEPKFYFDTRTAQTRITCVGSAVLNCNASSNSIMTLSFGYCLCSSFQRFMSTAKSFCAFCSFFCSLRASSPAFLHFTHLFVGDHYCKVQRLSCHSGVSIHFANNFQFEF